MGRKEERKKEGESNSHHKKMGKPGTTTHVCDDSTQEAEAGGHEGFKVILSNTLSLRPA